MPRPSLREGYALLAVLIVVVVLSLVAYKFTDVMTAEYIVALRSAESAQAKTYAASGIHYVAGILADQEAMISRLGGNPYDNPTEFANIPIGPQDGNRLGGRFSLISVGDTYSVGAGEARYLQRYGVIDESGKLNINALMAQDSSGDRLREALMKLPNMTEDIADAIVDWLDSDDNPRELGAESAYYLGIFPPYRAKNGPLNSLDELLLVRGVTPQLLYGNDRNRNGRMDQNEIDGYDFDRGWSEYLTIYGRELNADAMGNPRINLNDTEMPLATMAQDLTVVLGQEMSDYLMAARLFGTSSSSSNSSSSGSSSSGGSSGGGSSGGSSGGSGGSSSGGGVTTVTEVSGGSGRMTFVMTTTSSQQPSNSSSQTIEGSADDLRAAVQAALDAETQPKGKVSGILNLANTQVTLPKPAGSPQDAPTVFVRSPLNDPEKMSQYLPLLLEYTTTRSEFEMTPRINVNTAPPEVLATLPELEPEQIDTLLSVRGSLDPLDPDTLTGAWMVTKANIPASTFQNLEPYVTGRTMTFRAHSVGYFGRGGPVARMEAVIDTNQGFPRILYFRDVTDLGRGFEVPRE